MRLENKDGFTFIDILISIAILAIFIGIYMDLQRDNYIEKKRTDEINKMTMVAQGIMDAYRNSNLTNVNNNLTTLSQGYNASITVNAVTTMPTSNPTNQTSSGLNEVIITVNPNPISLNINPVKLISYSS